jgi:hypothetical protein
LCNVGNAPTSRHGRPPVAYGTMTSAGGGDLMTTTPDQPDQRPADDFIPTEELARRQGVQPIASVSDLAAAVDPFESDEEYAAFLDDLYASRRADIA